MEKSMASQFSNRLQHLLQQLGWNQLDLARMLDISQPTISTYLNGRIPPADVLFRLAEISGKNMEWFFSQHTTQQMVKEPPPLYRPQDKLQALWSKLPAALQQQFLELIQEVVKNINTDAAE